MCGIVLRRFLLVGPECIYTFLSRICAQLFSWRQGCRKIWVRTPYTPSSQSGEEGNLPFQAGQIAVEVILVSRRWPRVGVLPESMVTPPIRQSADARSIASDPQWAVRSERGAVSGARSPPIGGGVNHWVPPNAGMVSVGEIPDPANHRSGAQAIASGTVWVICPIGHKRLVDRSRRLKIHDPYIRYREHLGG